MVDTCVLLDVGTEDAEWFAWSAETLRQLANEAMLVINPVIHSEVSVSSERIEEMESLLGPEVFEYRPIPRKAAFLAGVGFIVLSLPTPGLCFSRGPGSSA